MRHRLSLVNSLETENCTIFVDARRKSKWQPSTSPIIFSCWLNCPALFRSTQQWKSTYTDRVTARRLAKYRSAVSAGALITLKHQPYPKEECQLSRCLRQPKTGNTRRLSHACRLVRW